MRILSSDPEQVRKRQRYATDPEYRAHRNQETRKWKEKNRDRALTGLRGCALQRHYGITLDDYERMLVEQGRGCAACKSTNPEGKGRFHVDHCHATGKIRGLLCHHCNLALGNVKDSVDRLQQLAEYLLRTI